jgi:hypothetical protein
LVCGYSVTHSGYPGDYKTFADGFPIFRAALMKIVCFVVYDASSIIKQLEKIGKELIPFFLWTQIFQDNLKLLLEAKPNM